MQNAAEYLEKTRSAVAKLFEGIDTYLALLRQHPTFVTSYTNQEDLLSQYDVWFETNCSSIRAALEAQKQYIVGPE